MRYRIKNKLKTRFLSASLTFKKPSIRIWMRIKNLDTIRYVKKLKLVEKIYYFY